MALFSIAKPSCKSNVRRYCYSEYRIVFLEECAHERRVRNMKTILLHASTRSMLVCVRSHRAFLDQIRSQIFSYIYCTQSILILSCNREIRYQVRVLLQFTGAIIKYHIRFSTAQRLNSCPIVSIFVERTRNNGWAYGFCKLIHIYI